MTDPAQLPQKKALQINLDKRIFGTFAEIGAGQEVVRHFFQAGAAAGTIAKTISAYDMTFSDEIYGKSGRYVSKERLGSMLEHEYALLLQRLSAKRGADTLFFTFADTVAAKGFKGNSECHGWLGIRFQADSLTPASDIVIHVRMLDKLNIQQQEVLGAVGVNLVHGAFYCPNPAENLIPSLIEGLSNERIEIDMVEVSGPHFKDVDNRLLSLQLVQLGLTNACMFAPSGKVLQPSEHLYKKAVLLERGSFRPITHVHVDMLETARTTFTNDTLKGQECLILAELTLNNLMSTGSIDMQDFLARVDTVSSLGYTVLISNYPQFYRLIGYLRRYTKEPIGLAMGVNTLLEVFNEKHYEMLEGGILESLGRLFAHSVQLFVYPMSRPAFDEYVKLFNPPYDAVELNGSELLSADNLPIMPNLRLLYSHLQQRQSIIGIKNYNTELLKVLSRDTLKRIGTAGDTSWENVVPKSAAELIKRRNLLGYKTAEDASASIVVAAPVTENVAERQETQVIQTDDPTPRPLH